MNMGEGPHDILAPTNSASSRRSRNLKTYSRSPEKIDGVLEHHDAPESGQRSRDWPHHRLAAEKAPKSSSQSSTLSSHTDESGSDSQASSLDSSPSSSEAQSSDHAPPGSSRQAQALKFSKSPDKRTRSNGIIRSRRFAGELPLVSASQVPQSSLGGRVPETDFDAIISGSETDERQPLIPYSRNQRSSKTAKKLVNTATVRKRLRKVRICPDFRGQDADSKRMTKPVAKTSRTSRKRISLKHTDSPPIKGITSLTLLSGPLPDLSFRDATALSLAIPLSSPARPQGDYRITPRASHIAIDDIDEQPNREVEHRLSDPERHDADQQDAAQDMLLVQDQKSTTVPFSSDYYHRLQRHYHDTDEDEMNQLLPPIDPAVAIVDLNNHDIDYAALRDASQSSFACLFDDEDGSSQVVEDSLQHDKPLMAVSCASSQDIFGRDYGMEWWW